MSSFSEIDDAICAHLVAGGGHPTNRRALEVVVLRHVAGPKPWRVIARRMRALSSSGRIEYDRHRRTWSVGTAAAAADTQQAAPEDKEPAHPSSD